MAKSAVSFKLESNDLPANIAGMEDKFDRVVKGIAEYGASQGEAYMKSNAPWTDRTANARNTLGAKAFHDKGTHTIVLYGGMPYQINLETMQEGRFAIIQPTLRVVGDRCMSLLNNAIAKMQ